MVFKLFSNIHIGTNSEIKNKDILSKYKIKFVISIKNDKNKKSDKKNNWNKNKKSDKKNNWNKNKKSDKKNNWNKNKKSDKKNNWIKNKNLICYIYFLFSKYDELFFETLNISISYIQNAISKNENILICCDDGYTETVPIIINYLIKSLNMNFDNAQIFVTNYLINNNLEFKDNKYLDKLYRKFVN